MLHSQESWADDPEFCKSAFCLFNATSLLLVFAFHCLYCFLQVADSNEVLNICVFKGILYMPLNVFRATVEKVAEVALFSGGLHLFEATQARAVVKISTEKSRICFAFLHC